MPSRMSKADIGQKCHREWQSAETHRAKLTSLFNTLALHARPTVSIMVNQLTGGGSSQGTPASSQVTKLYDSTLVRAVGDHASGIKAWLSPSNSEWFQAEPPDMLEDDEPAKRWYARVGEIMEKHIAASNFHAVDFEAVLDGAAFGTRAMIIEPSKRGEHPFVAQRWEPGTFAMLENEEGEIDSTFQQLSLTCRQAVKKFGLEQLPPKVADRYNTKPDSTETDQYVLCIYPREDDEYTRESLESQDMPIASNWIHAETKMVVKVSGFEEMPAIVSRYQRWGGTPFGIAPALLALSDARQINNIQMSLDLLVAIAANPRLLIPVEMEGEVNMLPGGPTFYGDPNRIPKAWGTEGSIQEGEQRVKMRRADIERVLSLDVFRTFRNITKEITATEALEIRQEAIDLFSPTFSLMGYEHYTRALQRIFLIMLRGGWFPEPPRSVLIPISKDEGVIREPKITFTSRIALAIAQRHKAAIGESLQRRMELSNVIGEAAFDDVRIPEMLKHVDRTNGVPERFFKTAEEVAEVQEARQAQQAQQQMLEQAKTAAEAMQKSGVTPDQAAQLAAQA